MKHILIEYEVTTGNALCCCVLCWLMCSSEIVSEQKDSTVMSRAASCQKEMLRRTNIPLQLLVHPVSDVGWNDVFILVGWVVIYDTPLLHEVFFSKSALTNQLQFKDQFSAHDCGAFKALCVRSTNIAVDCCPSHVDILSSCAGLAACSSVEMETGSKAWVIDL